MVVVCVDLLYYEAELINAVLKYDDDPLNQ
jgi:hypothetical protein